MKVKLMAIAKSKRFATYWVETKTAEEVEFMQRLRPKRGRAMVLTHITEGMDPKNQNKIRYSLDFEEKKL